MVWVEYFVPETKLETSEWDLSPLSCSLGFVNLKPSKLCAQELNKQIPNIQDDSMVHPSLSFILLLCFPVELV